MRVLGVLDLMHGRAVHARAGDRDQYEAVRAVAGNAIEPGDPAALGRAYRDGCGVDELYVADLDAIMGHAAQSRSVSELAAGGPVWLDAAVSSVERAEHALTLGIARVIVGLETLCSWEALREICASIGGDRVAFSLDLRDGALMARADVARGEPAHVVAALAVEAGVDSIVVIDVRRVGTGAGLDLELIRRVRQAAPGVALLAGGGVRGIEDIQRLADVGCDGVLIATALQRGTLGAADVQKVRSIVKP